MDDSYYITKITLPPNKCYYCQGFYKEVIPWRGNAFRCDKCHENKRLKVEIENLKRHTTELAEVIVDLTKEETTNGY